MAQDTDPVGSGFVASLARPGGNITGLATLAPELSGKQLELMKEIVPRLSRVAVLGSSTEPGNAQSLRETELAAGAFGVKLQYLDVLDPKDIEPAFRTAAKGRANGVLVVPTPVVLSHRAQIAVLAVEPAPSDLRQARICGRRRAHDLRREHYRLVSARCNLRGQDSQRCKARRSAGGAADQIRIRDQPESR